MSVQATTWAWTVKGLPTHLRLTLLAIADACNAEGYGYPGQVRLAAQLECSDRQVRSNIANLGKLGLLAILIRPGSGDGRKSNGYQLCMEALATPRPLPAGGLATGSPPPPVSGRPALATGSRLPEATGSRLPEATGSPLPPATGSPAPGNRKCGVGQPEVATSSDPLVEPSERTKDSLCAARTLGAVVQRSALPEPEGFARFWAAWPAGQRKRGRKMALAAWQALHLEDQADAIVADVERRRDHDDFWLRGYAPMPQTYLRGARWEDELTQAPPQRSPTPTR
jgi:hypothetical protein